MSSFLQTQPQPEESGALKSLMTPTFAYQKLFSHHPLFLPLFFFFVCVNWFWLSASEWSLCLCLLWHISSSQTVQPPAQLTPPPSLIPSCPWRETKLAHLFNEVQSWECEEEAPFPHTLKKCSQLHPKSWVTTTQPLFNPNPWRERTH